MNQTAEKTYFFYPYSPLRLHRSDFCELAFCLFDRHLSLLKLAAGLRAEQCDRGESHLQYSTVQYSTSSLTADSLAVHKTSSCTWSGRYCCWQRRRLHSTVQHSAGKYDLTLQTPTNTVGAWDSTPQCGSDCLGWEQAAAYRYNTVWNIVEKMQEHRSIVQKGWWSSKHAVW